MKTQTRWIGRGLAIVAMAGVALAGVAMPGAGALAAQPSAALQENARPARSWRPERFESRRAPARGELRRFLESIQATEAQRASVVEEAGAAEPIVREARRELAAIRSEARRRSRTKDVAAAREELRGKKKELRERTLERLRPLARRVLSSLTSEQRAKLAGAGTRGGKGLDPLDDDRLVQITSWLLTRPMARSQSIKVSGQARRAR